MSETDKRQFLGMEGVKTLLAGLEGEYSPLGHAHDDLIESIEKITDGTTTVAHATEATHSSTSDEAIHAESADKDGEGNVITETYAKIEDIPEPDWNENDPSKEGYIENRPFYEEPGEQIIFEEENVTASSSAPYIIENFDYFEENSTYKVIWNGTEYICSSYIADGPGTPSIGNATLIGVSGGGSGEPFFITVFNNNLMIFAEIEGTYTVCISKSGTIVHKIDEKFLPELPESIGEATEGKTYQIYYPQYDSTWDEIASEGAEIFNDYNTNKAVGMYSHAEGSQTLALALYSHTEGFMTESRGDASHSEGNRTIANGMYSHAEGDNTIASSKYQHTQGRYNIEDTGNNYAHIVGNGTADNARSNAHTVDWNGNGWFQGDVYVGGLSQKDAKVKKLLHAGSIYDGLFLKDQSSGLEYLLTITNGSLQTSPRVESLKIDKNQDKIDYTDSDLFDPTGLVVSIVCVDGSTRVIENYTYDKYVEVGATTHIIEYEELGNVFTATVPVVTRDLEAALQDFYYTVNDDGTYTITDWKQTLNGEPSTKVVIPNSPLVRIH